MRIIAVILLACFVSACVTPGEIAAHQRALDAWERVEIARAQANAHRYDALIEVSRHGNEAAQVAVAMAVGLPGGGGTVAVSSPMPVAPDNDRAFKWASLILPNTVALGSGYFGYRLGVAQSNNSARMTEASYNAFSAIGTAGLNGERDIANAAFNGIDHLPQGITISGSGNVFASGGNASLDNSHRCAPTVTASGSAAPGGSPTATGATGTGATTQGNGGAGAGPVFTQPFNC